MKGPDEYSDVLGMTPREHEAKMRKWYVMLAIALFFSVFGEGILMLTAKAKERRESRAARESSTPRESGAPRAPGAAPQR